MLQQRGVADPPLMGASHVIFIDFGLTLGSLLAPFWLPWAPFCLPWAPFWHPWAHFWHPWAHFWLTFSIFWLTFTVSWSLFSYFYIFSIKMSCELVFLHNFYSIFDFYVVLQTTTVLRIPAAVLQHSCSSPAAFLQHSCSIYSNALLFQQTQVENVYARLPSRCKESHREALTLNAATTIQTLSIQRTCSMRLQCTQAVERYLQNILLNRRFHSLQA